MVFPVTGQPDDDGNKQGGSGFLVMVDAQIYLATVAHLATRQAVQKDDWSTWDDQLILHSPAGEPVAPFSLFEVTSGGGKSPRFKFSRTYPDPTRLVDMILLPLDPAHPIVGKCEIFHLPYDSAVATLGQTVTMIGCRPWPEVNQQPHVLTEVDSIHHVRPQQEDGYSGCPVVDSNGLLVGMPFGGDLPGAPDRGLIVSAHIIQATAGFLDGRAATAVTI